MNDKVGPNIGLTSGAMLLVLAAVWGGSFFFVEVALTALPPLWIALIRVAFAAPILGAIVWWKGLAVPRSWRIWVGFLGMGALNNAIPFSLLNLGQKSIELGLASILNGTTAIFAAFVAGLFLIEEPLRLRKIVGAGIGVVGVGVVIGPNALFSMDVRDVAQLLILGAALSYAFASVWGKLMLAGQPAIVNAFGMIICANVLLIPTALWVEGVPSFDLPIAVWGALGGVALLSTVLAYLLYFAIMARAGAANLMLVTLLIPVFAILLGVLVLGERLALSAIAGLSIISVGLLVTDGRIGRWLVNALRAKT